MAKAAKVRAKVKVATVVMGTAVVGPGLTWVAMVLALPQIHGLLCTMRGKVPMATKRIS